jgi:hypothetical protein
MLAAIQPKTLRDGGPQIDGIRSAKTNPSRSTTSPTSIGVDLWNIGPADANVDGPPKARWLFGCDDTSGEYCVLYAGKTWERDFDQKYVKAD